MCVLSRILSPILIYHFVYNVLICFVIIQSQEGGQFINYGFFLTTVYSKVGIVTKHFTLGHFVYEELGRVSIHTASKEITDSFPYSDLSILPCFCTVVNK